MMGDRRGLSPVVGDTLLVGVAVVVAVPVVLFGLVFVGGVGSDVPTATFEAGSADGNVTITHVSGDEIPVSELAVVRESETVPVEQLVDSETLAAGDSVSLDPKGAAGLRLVWTGSEESAILHRVDGYTVTERFEFEGERPQTLDVSNVETATVTLSGAGGEAAGYSDGGSGGAVSATVDLRETNTLEVYVGESPESTPSDPEGGWGWRRGGEPIANGGSFVGGGGAGATALVADGSPILVADGGGGGADFDTYSFYPGGGGARGGDGGPVWYGATAGDGDGSGDGGGGAGGTVGGDEDSFVPATDGGGAVLDSSLVSDPDVTVGGGAGPDTNATVAVTYTVD